MTKIVNNTDLDKVGQAIAGGSKNKQNLRKPAKLQGKWNLDPNEGYQFGTELPYEKVKEVIEIDSPSFLGVNGDRLGTIAYYIYPTLVNVVLKYITSNFKITHIC